MVATIHNLLNLLRLTREVRQALNLGGGAFRKQFRAWRERGV